MIADHQDSLLEEYKSMLRDEEVEGEIRCRIVHAMRILRHLKKNPLKYCSQEEG